MTNRIAVDLLKQDVVLEHREWINENPGRTLAQLRRRLQLALSQCRDIARGGDPYAGEHTDTPEPLASEIALWPDSGEDGRPRRFSERAVELERYVRRLLDLEAAIGGHYRVGQLLDGGR